MRSGQWGRMGAATDTFERMARDAQGAMSIAEFRKGLVRAAQRYVGSDSAAMLDFPSRSANAGEVRSHIAGLGTSAGYEAQWAANQHRYFRSIERLLGAMESGDPIIDGDVYRMRERERLAAYAEILVPQGATSILSALVRYRGRSTAMIVLKRHGRGGFRSKDTGGLKRILPALGLADAGFHYSMAADPPRVQAQGNPTLSPREAQVAELACKGMHNQEIALLLGTSAETVKKQISSVFEKAGVSNRTELAMLHASQRPG
jgi:DNA-binding CsgD family transcriptional regulator